MKEAASAGKTNVIIELAPSLKRFTVQGEKDREALEGFISQYLNDLMTDLAIPGEISLDTRLPKDKEKPIRNSYQVVVNEQKCRLPLPTVVSQDVQAKELPRSLAKNIHQNRELFLTVPLSSQIREKWSSEIGKAWLPDLSIKGFHDFLSTLVCRGFSIERGKAIAQVIRDNECSEWTVENMSEQATSGVDAISIRVFLSEVQYHRVVSSNGTSEAESVTHETQMEEMLGMMRDGLFYELGILLPKVDLKVDESLEDNEFRIQLNDLRLPIHAGLEQDQFLVNDTPDRLALLGLSGEKAINPANGSECAKVRNRNGALKRCEEAGLTTWDPIGYLILTLSAEIRRNAGIFLNNEIVKFNLSQLRRVFPALIDVVERRIELHELTRILRDLLDEELSIRDLRGILEALIAIESTTDVDQVKNIVFSPHNQNLLRISLNRYISHKHTRGGNTVVVFLLDDQIETRLMQKRPSEVAERGQLLEALFGELGDLPPTAQNPVILTKIEIRRKLKRLIGKEFPHVAVLCYQDLSPDMNIQPVARIFLSE